MMAKEAMMLNGGLESKTMEGRIKRRIWKQYVLGRNKLYKGLMMRIDDEKKEVQAIEKKACRGISMHFEWGPLLNIF
jgi:hypothetical protein